MQTKTIGSNGTSLIVPERYQPPADLQTNGRTPNKWQEIGTSGLESYSGFITEAHNTRLYWPAVYEEYERLRRSCPPIVMTRQVYSAQAPHVKIEVVLPDKPTPDEQRLGEFYESELENVEGGIGDWLDQYLAQVPFHGWGWWEVVQGVRSRDWRPPGEDDWESEADDGLIGVRRLAWRSQSSLDKWELTDDTGRLRGMWQQDYPNERTLLPLDRSLHVTFGDSVNPEGLTPFESVWKLDYVQRAFEKIMGIGSEKAAGYLRFLKTESGQLTPQDEIHLAKAAGAVLSAQEKNYLALPYGFTADVMDTTFTAAPAILEIVRYYGLIILQLYNMAHIAIATTAGTGAYSARESGNNDFVFGFNAMTYGAVKQYDQQVGRRLYQWNASSFPGARRPHYRARPLDKLVGLSELSEFWTAISATMPVGDDDFIAIRTKSGILPETLPEVEETEAAPDVQPAGGGVESPENVNTKGLNGAQITAVLDVLGKMASGEINKVVALELLIAVGIEPDRARRIVAQDIEPMKEEPEQEPAADEDDLQDYTHPRYRLPDSIGLSEFIGFVDGLCIPAISHSATSVYYDEDGKLRQAVLELAQERGVDNTAEVVGMLMLADRRKKDLLFMDEGDLSELAARPFTVPADELPDDIGFEAVITDADINRAIRKAAKANPLLGELLNARVINDDENN